MKSLQAFLLVCLYAAWLLILWRRGLHRRWPLLAVYCALAIPFNAAIWWVLLYRWAAIVMLAFRLLPGIEALYLIAWRGPARALLLTATLLIEAGMLVPAFADMQWAYMPIRNLILAGESILMLVTVLCDWRWPLDCDPRDRFHLRALTAWMWILTAASLLHPWYGGTMTGWLTANAIYIAALAGVVSAYRYVPTGSGGGFSSRSAATW